MRGFSHDSLRGRVRIGGGWRGSEGRGGDGVRDRTRSRDRVGRAGIDNAEARPKRGAQWVSL